MKTILFPTDFSKNAVHAAQIYRDLGKKFECTCGVTERACISYFNF